MPKITTKTVMEHFCKGVKTKEEAFLIGVLYGYGGHYACRIPDYKLMKKFPETIDAEKKMREVFEEIHSKDILEIQELLESLKNNTEGKYK